MSLSWEERGCWSGKGDKLYVLGVYFDGYFVIYGTYLFNGSLLLILALGILFTRHDCQFSISQIPHGRSVKCCVKHRCLLICIDKIYDLNAFLNRLPHQHP